MSFDAQAAARYASETIRLEAESVAGLQDFVDEGFLEAARLLHEGRGRAVVTGIGKSAVIAQKIVATFNSTGTPSLFLHAADAVHGDLGAIQTDDVVIVVSKSGESPEIRVLLPLLRSFGNKIIALCGAPSSYLAAAADCLVNSSVEKEACPHNLAPTTSTTAQLVMGDALAVTLLQLKGFSVQDFARYHPGGALGKRLYLRVRDLLRSDTLPPAVRPDARIRDVIWSISSGRLGATVVTDESGGIHGIITDGDLRRMLEHHEDPRQLRAADILTQSPKIIAEEALAVDALETMRTHDITQLVVVDEVDAYVGLVHLHDLLREGLM
jgi:arabinose-5-phosphate isomerase